MPIRPEDRFFYPIDWPQLSAVIRFVRAKGACEGCGRPHGRIVLHLGDGRWWDAQAGSWRDGQGRRLPAAPTAEAAFAGVRTTRVFLATGHRNHDTADNRDANLAAWCQRCHIQHDAPEHARRRRLTYLRRRRPRRPLPRPLPRSIGPPSGALAGFLREPPTALRRQGKRLQIPL